MANKPKVIKRSLSEMLAAADAQREGAAIAGSEPEPDAAPAAQPEPAAEVPAPAPARPVPAPRVAVRPPRKAAPVAAPARPGALRLPEDEEGAPAVTVTFFLTEEDRLRLKTTGMQAKLSLNDICHEALNLWLEGRGLAPLTWTPANRPSGKRRG